MKVLFYEYAFLYVFLPCVLLVYYGLPARLRNGWLFVASCGLDAASSLSFLPLNLRALFDTAEYRALPIDSFLDQLVAGVRQRGVEVVDLTEVYRRTPTPCLYLPDDSHWNARAADLAARSWAAALGPLPDVAAAGPAEGIAR